MNNLNYSIIGLHGKKRSGKDFGFKILKEYLEFKFDCDVKKISFAEKLKLSVSKLFNMTIEDIERMKEDESISFINYSINDGKIINNLTMREFLQRYGDEAHRRVFGDNFWVENTLSDLDYLHERYTFYIVTDCRYNNEAEGIISRDGVILKIINELDDIELYKKHYPFTYRILNATSEHPSEKSIRDEFIRMLIYNDKNTNSYKRDLIAAIDSIYHASFGSVVG